MVNKNNDNKRIFPFSWSFHMRGDESNNFTSNYKTAWALSRKMSQCSGRGTACAGGSSEEVIHGLRPTGMASTGRGSGQEVAWS